MQIRVDDLSGQVIRALIVEHLNEMRGLSPACSVHALDLDGLTRPDVTFWTAWRDGELLGCGALKQLTVAHGEIKSMRTASTHRREGVASALLRHIVSEGRTRSYERLSLETGAGPAFEPARRMWIGRWSAALCECTRSVTIRGATFASAPETDWQHRSLRCNENCKNNGPA